MKAKSAKFGNAIQVGPESLTYVTSAHYEIELQSNLFLRVSRRSRPDEVCITSLFNTIYMIPEPGSEEPEVRRKRAFQI